MRKLKYILLFILSITLFNSCLIDDTSDIDLNDDGKNVVTFERVIDNLTCTATGDEYTFEVKMKIVGPTLMDLTNDINVTITASTSSTAIENTHYRIVNPTFVLSESNNYHGLLKIILISEGNSAPMDGTPEFEDYVAPVLILDISTSGDSRVIGSGKSGQFTLNFIPPNPYAGDYDVEMRYFHPTAGGSYPDDPYGGVRLLEKTLAPITGRRCETLFAVWEDICWITINADNSINYLVDGRDDVALGDPYDETKVSHFDPATGKIYLYYHYYGVGGPRIFWEVFTPVAKK